MRQVCAWIVVSLAGLAVGCDAVVGAECRAGLTLCHGVCTAVCDGDGGASDGAFAFDGSTPPDSPSDGIDADAGVGPESGSADSSLESGSGDSGMNTDAGTGLDSGSDGGVLCVPPLVDCGGVCVDLTSDPDHCGSCSNYCGTGLCVDSMCVGGFPGHVVLVGHDYTMSRSAMRRVIGNAVFLARSTPVRVLEWVGTSTAASRTGTDSAITATATTLGRTWTPTVAATAADVTTMLPASDVLLVYAQVGSTDGELDILGTGWSAALATFLASGGVVVVTDAATPSNLGTYQVLTAAGLMTCSGETDISRTTVTVHAPADAIALGVPLTYRAESNSVRFATTDGIDVIGDATGPVVVDVVVTP